MSLQKGYVQDAIDTEAALRQLESHLESFPERVKQFSEIELLSRPVENKWSKKEILGHLIDSAVNNLKRFTDIQLSVASYKIIPYNQTGLVTVNDYQNLSTDHLLDLWMSLNRQIIFVIKKIPAEKLHHAVDPGYENGEMKTLGWVICDYVAHMEHHFRQIFPSEQ